jgi:hypothetical protein
MEQINIRRMSPNDIDAACKILGLAFADNPTTLMVARGDRARAQRITESGARFASDVDTVTCWSPRTRKESLAS